MRDLTTLERYRNRTAELAVYGITGNSKNGMFSIPDTDTGETLTVIASDGMDWEHVSVSKRNRCPTWEQMEKIKRMFFNDDETCVQYHVPPAEHVNMHPFCLHLWRPTKAVLPKPPSIMVGV